MYHLPLARVHINTRTWIFFLHLEFQPQTSNWNLIFNFFFFFNNQSVLVFSTSPLLYCCWVYLGDPSDSSFFPLILHIFNSSHLSIVVPLSIFFFDYDSIQESVSVWRAYPCLSVLSFELLRLEVPYPNLAYTAGSCLSSMSLVAFHLQCSRVMQESFSTATTPVRVVKTF